MKDDKIYEMLNNAEIDLNEYEVEELSSEEKERYKTRIRMEVKRMNRETKNKKNKNIRKIAAGMAAACAVAVGVAGFSNSALADSIYSNTIGKLIGATQGDKDEKELSDIYSTIGKESTELVSDNQCVLETDQSGVKISVSDVYCDGYLLYYTTTLSTDNEKLNESDWIMGPQSDKVMENVSINETLIQSAIGQPFEKAEDGSYVKMEQIDLSTLTDENDNPIDISDLKDFTVTWSIDTLEGYLSDAWDENGEYQTTTKVSGDWQLSFPVHVDTSKNETIAVNKEDNGVAVSQVIKTGAVLIVDMQLPDITGAPYNDPHNDPDIFITDEAGNAMWWLGGRSTPNEDGSQSERIMLLYNGESTIHISVTNKNGAGESIAELDVDLK